MTPRERCRNVILLPGGDSDWRTAALFETNPLIASATSASPIPDALPRCRPTGRPGAPNPRAPGAPLPQRGFSLVGFVQPPSESLEVPEERVVTPNGDLLILVQTAEVVFLGKGAR